MPEHGGALKSMARRYGIVENEWIDLSTGINPHAWQVTEIPEKIWQRLPEEDDGLIEVACRYYQAKYILPVAGSQAAIQLLPRLRKPCKVGILSPTYAEHAHCWQQAGHEVIHILPDGVEQALPALDVLVIVNPNNPSGELISTRLLLDWHEKLRNSGGWLMVDEAYMDLMPQHSLAQHSDKAGLIVLRSIGKFFGLAGLRLGFVLGDEALLARLAEQLGPWSVSGPARYIGMQALQDEHWQDMNRHRLAELSARLGHLLISHGIQVNSAIALYKWFRHEQAAEIHEQLALRGIYCRYFPRDTSGVSSLRFGLPGNENEWQRLEQALRDIFKGNSEAVKNCKAVKKCIPA